MPTWLQTTAVISVATFLITIVPLVAKISRQLGKLDNLRDDFMLHRSENRADFQSVHNEISSVRNEIPSVRNEISSVRTELHHEISSLRKETHDNFKIIHDKLDKVIDHLLLLSRN
jgi:uncharacterized coiled-coil DUF342 family protein